MNSTDLYRLAVCARCEYCGRAGDRLFCREIDDNHSSVWNCDRSRAARFTSRLSMEKLTCERWQVQSCAACAFPDPLEGPELPLSATERTAWANDPAIRDRHIAALRSVYEAASRQTPPALDGEGLVVCGEGRYWPMIVVAVHMLRRCGSTLPVHVWHNSALGPIGHELDGLPGVYLVDADLVRQSHPARILRGWEIKTYAILHCGWQRVLFLDADAYCVADPRPLFATLDDAPFRFWSDLAGFEKMLQWPWYGVDGTGQATVQGGQLLIDVPQFWGGLLTANWINQHSDYFYAHQFGDQDSWRVLLALGQPGMQLLGPAEWHQRGVAFVIRAADQPAVIVHRCQGKFWGHEAPPTNPDLPREAEVLALLASLYPVTAQRVDTWAAKKERVRTERRAALQAR